MVVVVFDVSQGLLTPYVIPSQVTPQRVAQVYLEHVPLSALKGDTLKFIVFFSDVLGKLHLPKLLAL